MRILTYRKAWLDDDNSTWTSGEEVINRFGKLTERMPAAPLARVSRTAMEIQKLNTVSSCDNSLLQCSRRRPRFLVQDRRRKVFIEQES
eukprot:2930365-Amphidinium_carterae.2